MTAEQPATPPLFAAPDCAKWPKPKTNNWHGQGVHGMERSCHPSHPLSTDILPRAQPEMDKPPESHDLDDGRLPLRQYAEDQKRRSDSPSLARTESHSGTISHGFDDRVNPMDPHNTDTAMPLLDYQKKPRQTAPEKHHSSMPSYLTGRMRVNQSLIRLLRPGLVRCLISWVLIGAFYLSLYEFKDRVLSPRSKSLFDSITIALSIAFGLNVASALKAVALDLRWWVLSMEKRASREVDLILHCDSMTELLRLVLVAPRPRTIVVTLSWVSLNILIQAGIAVLGLTYSASPGLDDIYREPGVNNISIPNMTHFAPTAGRFDDDNTFLESFAAHVLGDIGSSYNFSVLPHDPLEGTPWASNPAGFWNATDHWEYHFLDAAPSSATRGVQFLAIYSNRIVKSTATCSVPPYQVSIEGQLGNIHLLDKNQTFTFPALAFGLESIYYLTTPIEDETGSDGSCGPGCSNVQAVEPAAGPPVEGSLVAGSNSTYFFYNCNVTVTSTTQDLPIVKAAQAAQAIALSGQIHPEFESTDEADNQYVAYNFGLPFGEPQNNSATGMASLISRFAIGVISAAAQTNPPMFVQGSLPAQGVRLQLDSILAFNLILIVTGITQLVLVLVSAVIVSRLVIPDEVLLSHQEAIRKRFVLGA